MSDGSCTRGTAGPVDPAWGVVDPAAGLWWPDRVHQLAALANPALTVNPRALFSPILAKSTSWRLTRR